MMSNKRRKTEEPRLRGVTTLSEVLLARVTLFLEFKEKMDWLRISRQFRGAFLYCLSTTENLDLALYSSLDARGLAALVLRCAPLLSLEVSYEHLEATLSLERAFNGSRPCQLRSLTLSKVTIDKHRYNFLAFLGYFAQSLTNLTLQFTPTHTQVVQLEDILAIYPNLHAFKYFFDTQFVDPPTDDDYWWACISLDFTRFHCPQLERIELSNLAAGCLQQLPSSVKAISLYYNEYTSVNPRTYPTEAELYDMLTHRTALTAFGFYAKHRTASHYHPRPPLSARLLSVLGAQPRFEALRLSVYCKHSDCIVNDINDMALLGLATAHPELQIVQLDSLKKVTEASVIALVRTCVQLQELSLDYCNINDTAIEVIADYAATTLTSLSLKGSKLEGEDCLESLLRNSPVLEKLDLACVPRVTSFTLFCMYIYSAKLKSIVLVNNDIDELGLCCLFQTTSLREIKVSEASDITDFLALKLSLNLRDFKDHWLSRQPEDEPLSALAEYLELVEFSSWVDGVLRSVSWNPNDGYDSQTHEQTLLSLYSQLQGVSRIPLSFSNIPFLHTLYLNETQLTDYTLGYLLSSCKRLSKLSVNHCRTRGEALRHHLRTQKSSLSFCSITHNSILLDTSEDLRRLARYANVKLIF